VHGLVVDIENGKLEWVVNGYEALERASTAQQPMATSMPEFKLGEMKFPDVQIGEVRAPEQATIGTPQPMTPISPVAPVTQQPVQPRHPAEPDELPEQPTRHTRSKIPLPKLDPQALFKIVGADKKIYGPVSGQELAQWMAEGRVTLSTLIQKIGNKKWQQVAELLTKDLPQEIPLPPPLRRVFSKGSDKK
jgi:hypothetical protein